MTPRRDLADPTGATPVLGVDGTRRGWVGVRWAANRLDTHIAGTLAELVELAGDVSVVAVDMPIGLEPSERRACDDAVRPLLGPRRSSLFSPPVIGALAFETYAEANRWSKTTTGRGLSKQAWMLVPKIREVRAFVAEATVPVYETFPELSFLAMAGAPLSHPKRTWTGFATRVALLRDHGLELPTDPGPAGAVAADDLVDAAALAWSARRIAEGVAECRPECVESATPDEQPTIWW